MEGCKSVAEVANSNIFGSNLSIFQDQNQSCHFQLWSASFSKLQDFDDRGRCLIHTKSCVSATYCALAEARAICYRINIYSEEKKEQNYTFLSPHNVVVSTPREDLLSSLCFTGIKGLGTHLFFQGRLKLDVNDLLLWLKSFFYSTVSQDFFLERILIISFKQG